MYAVSEKADTTILYKKDEHNCMITDVFSSCLAEPLTGVDNAIEELVIKMSVSLTNLSRFETFVRNDLVEQANGYVELSYHEVRAKNFTKLVAFLGSEDKQK